MGCRVCPETIVRGLLGLTKAAAGVQRAHEDVIMRRRRACRGCPSATRCANGVLSPMCRCAECGCLLRAKTANRDEVCPLGRWGAEYG